MKGTKNRKMPEDEEKVPKATKGQKRKRERLHQRQTNMAFPQECLSERMKG